MTFMLYQPKISIETINEYLHTYSPDMPMTPGQWARAQANHLEIGSLVFVLDRFYSPWNGSGIDTISGDNLSPAELAIVVHQTNGHRTVLTLNDSDFQYMPLESFLDNHASNALTSGSIFHFVVCASKSKLSQAKLSELELTAQRYQRRGKRVAGRSGRPDPAVAFLSILGASAPEPGDLLDIKQLCYQLFGNGHLKGHGGPLANSFIPVRAPQAAMAIAISAPAASSSTASVGPSKSQDMVDETEPVASFAPPTLPAARKARGMRTLPLVSPDLSSLLEKLEQQVAKASAKIERQVQNSHVRLRQSLAEILDRADSDEKCLEHKITEDISKLSAQLDGTAEQVRSALSSESAEARTSIEHLLEQSRQVIVTAQEDSEQELLATLDKIRDQIDSGAAAFQSEFTDKATGAQVRLESCVSEHLDQLRQCAQVYSDRLTDLAGALTTSLHQLVDPLSASLDGQLSGLEGEFDCRTEETIGRLTRCKEELIESVGRLLNSAKLEISNNGIQCSTERLKPKLAHLRDKLRGIIPELQQSFVETIESRGALRVAHFQPLLGTRQQELKQLLKNALSTKTDQTHRQFKELESILEDVNKYLADLHVQAHSLSGQTMQQIKEIESQIRLSVQRDQIRSATTLGEDAQALLDKQTSDGAEAVARFRTALEESRQQLSLRADSERGELTQTLQSGIEAVKSTAENSLNRVRNSLKDALEAIQNLSRSKLDRLSES